jgi:chemotaxis protein methyltransferase CheR
VKLETTDHPQLRGVMEFIRARTGLVFPPSRREDAEASVRKAMEGAHIDDSQRFVQLLDADESIFDELITSLTVSETYFFREPQQFEFIRLQILPELQRARPLDGGLRFWSAGCASGEEAYSLAILLEQEGLAQRATILATDISGAVLTMARRASYSSWSLRGNSVDAMAQYFHRRNDRFLLRDSFRHQVAFRSLNLAVDNYPSLATGTLNTDVILCRNVLIYFGQDTVARIARRLFAALAGGGWLITGPSDPPLWDHAPFETKVTEAGVFYRRSPQMASLPSRREPASSAYGSPRRVMVHETLATKGVATKPVQALPQAAPERTLSPDKFDREPPPSLQSPNDAAAYVSSIRVLADGGELHRAAAEAAAAVQVQPLATELHYIRAIILAGLGQYDEASASLRRVIYLDPSLAVAHFTLGSVLWRSGAEAETRRCYRNALALCAERPPEELLQLSEGETAGRMAEAARNQLALIDSDRETAP